MKYIVTNTGIVLFHNGKPVKIEKDCHKYLRIIRAFDLPEYQQESVITEVLEENFESYNKDGFEISQDEVKYQGEVLPASLAQKVRSIWQQGLPITLFGNFWNNLKKNPSSSSVRELYDFLAYKELPITEDGCFLAYKGLTNDHWSISGNKETKVIQGKVDSAGRIYNGIGQTIEVRRFDVDDNRNNHCSFGLHVGSLEYAEGFAQGQVVIVKVNPKDVVSVPDDCNCQKCRVSAYTVIDGFEQEITSAVTDEDGEELQSEEEVEQDAFLNRIDNYLNKKSAQGFDTVSVKAIQNSFSPDYPSRVRVLDAITDLGYVWRTNEDGVQEVLL